MHEAPEVPSLPWSGVARLFGAGRTAAMSLVLRRAKSLLTSVGTAGLNMRVGLARGLAWAGERCLPKTALCNDPFQLCALDICRDGLRQQDLCAGQFQAERELLQVAVSNIPVGIGMFDVSKRLIMCNQSYRDLYSVPDRLAIRGTPLRAMLEHRVSLGNFEGQDKDAYVARLMKLVEEKGSIVRRAELADGRVIRIKQRQVEGIGWISMHEDITDAARAEAMIAHLARHDALTDLYNRIAFEECTSEALAGVKTGTEAAVLMIDLDRFKLVNDTLGHLVGDMLLKAVAQRLQATVRQGDAIARLGGDEFAIVQVGATQPQAACALAERVVESLDRPFMIDGHDISIGASVGIAIAPVHGESTVELLKSADSALYCAKENGRGRARCFDLQ